MSRVSKPAAAKKLVTVKATAQDLLLIAHANWATAEAIQAELDAGANPNAVEPENGCTALHVAARVGNAALVEVLLRAGAHVQVAAKRSKATPLYDAVMKGDLACVQMLLAAGARTDVSAGKLSATPLTLAAQMGREDLVRALLAAGAAVSAPDEAGSTPISAAAYANDKPGCEATMRALLDAGALPGEVKILGVGVNAEMVRRVLAEYGRQ